MYRYKSPWRKRQTPKEVAPWKCMQRIRTYKQPTFVHVLAAWDEPAYLWLLQQLCKKCPIERITIGLWSKFPTTMKQLAQMGFGMGSPTAIRHFRDHHFKMGVLPANKEVMVTAFNQRLVELQKTWKTANRDTKAILDAEDRLGIVSKRGDVCRELLSSIADAQAQTEIQLALYKP